MHERDIEGELDAALARYAAVEPRGGFEQRVLSNLREQPPVATRFSWARWVAAGLAAASLAALLILIGERHATVVNVKPVTVQDESAKASAPSYGITASTNFSIESAQAQSQRRLTTESVKRTRKKQVAQTNAEAAPKLAQFPAPAPLTEQEKLLIQFVQYDPAGAALFAEVRAKELQRASDEMQPSVNETDLQEGRTY